MSKHLIVAVFKSLEAAETAGRNLRDLEQKDEGFKIESGVLVQKGPHGELSVLSEKTRPFWGTVVGAVTGGLVGLLGGPAAAQAGFTLGAGAGLTTDALANMLDSTYMAGIAGDFVPGTYASILEATEPTPFGVDNIVWGQGGTVHRKPLA